MVPSRSRALGKRVAERIDGRSRGLCTVRLFISRSVAYPRQLCRERYADDPEGDCQSRPVSRFIEQHVHSPVENNGADETAAPAILNAGPNRRQINR